MHVLLHILLYAARIILDKNNIINICNYNKNFYNDKYIVSFNQVIIINLIVSRNND